MRALVRLSVTAALASSLITISSSAQSPVPPPALDARASDPVAMGWMVGAPPPAEQLVRFADGSGFRFPQTRWSFSNLRQLIPTVAATLIAEGALDDDATVVSYLPELRSSAIGDATIRQLLDMTIGLDYTEDYTDPRSPVWELSRAGGVLARPSDYRGPFTVDSTVLHSPEEASSHLARSGALRRVDEARRSVQRHPAGHDARVRCTLRAARPTVDSARAPVARAAFANSRTKPTPFVHSGRYL